MSRQLIFGFALSLVLMVSPAWAHNTGENGPAIDAENATFAMMFNLAGIMAAPTDFDEVGIGARYAISKKLHLRAAFGLDNLSTEVDPEGGTSTTDASSEFILEAGLDVVLRRTENLVLYTGGLFSWGLSAEDPDGDDNNEEGNAFEIAALAGVSWFFTQNVSLGAEYRLGIEHNSTETDTGVKTTDLQVGTNAVALHLGFWF